MHCTKGPVSCYAAMGNRSQDPNLMAETGADKATVVARVLTLIYFLFFLLMPWYTARDKTKPVPERVVWK